MPNGNLGFAAFGLAAIIAFSPPSRADVVNGGFETGTLAGWTQIGDTSFSGVSTLLEHSGLFGAFFGPITPGGISQTIATVAGTVYEVDFWLELGDPSPNTFTWSWNGIIQNPALTNSPGFNYSEFSSLVTATGAFSTLSFTFTNPDSYWLLDDVHVTAVPPTAAVPEPPAVALTITALLLLFGTARVASGCPLTRRK
jgi:hypothetical protein